MTGTGVVTSKGQRRVPSAVGLGAVLIVVVWSGVSVAQAFNPSFEITFAGLPHPRPLPLYWGRVDHPSFNSYCTNIWSTDGELAAALLSRAGGSFSPGNYQSFRQIVDLTEVSSIVFDVGLTASAGVFEHFEASFLIDAVPVWRANTEGIYYNQQVNVAGLSEIWPWHVIEIRLTALHAGVFDRAYWALWDNIRFLAEPLMIPATISLNPATLNVGSNGRWVTCYIELDEGYDVTEIDGATVTLDGIPACVAEHGWATPWANEDNITDHDGDGIPERMVKFSREAVQAILAAPETTVTIQGYLIDGTLFEGTSVLRVVDKTAPLSVPDNKGKKK